ncbi:Caspase Dronc [Eumeta japonica]|uniref:Caspase Dronc n=1 Tax=Eumeta variegata TaxID=151549 RepID=A0A4C1X170_EUMVA|nr:Caspase Dronc [Eumeta japonica]
MLTEVGKTLQVDESIVSNLLRVLGMIQKQGHWVPYKLKPRDVEWRILTSSNFKVVKSTKFVDRCSDGREPYSARSRHRGALLIFSFIEFEYNIEKYRQGAEVDCDNLKNLFNEIGFDKPTVYTNLKKAEMLHTITALDQMDALVNVDCVFVVVSSHGYERRATSDTDIRCSDGGLVSSYAIIERFNNHRCPKLKNIPKIFIFQICRGTNMDLLSPPIHMFHPNDRVEADGSSIQVPLYSDILIVHSTLPGFSSYRDQLLGSFYIQALCEVFAAHAHDNHIKDLFELVDEKLKEKFGVQTSSVDSWGFNKKLYLHPGLFED